MPNDKIFFFETSDDLHLLGFFHIPERIKYNIGIIYTHPFAEEQNCSHSIVVKAAREFTKLGIPVMRFDMRGLGDSQGELGDASIENWLTDVKRAVKVFKDELKIEKLGYWGLRCGCALNVLAANDERDALFNILWQPVFEFDTYIQQFIRQILSTEIATQSSQNKNMNALLRELDEKGTLEIMGYTISLSLYQSFINAGNVVKLFPYENSTYLASVSLMEKPNYAISRFAKYLEANKTPAEIAHIKAEPFWDRYWQWNSNQLIESTAKWLNTEVLGRF